jgi:hypothetical protein
MHKSLLLLNILSNNMTFLMDDDEKLRKLYRHIKDSPLLALCSVHASTDVGANASFDSSRALPGDTFFFRKGPSFTDQFEATVFGIVANIVSSYFSLDHALTLSKDLKDGYTLVTLEKPYEPGPEGSDVRQLD